MKKTILVSLLLTVAIGIRDLLIFKSTINDNYLISKQEKIISKNAKKSFNPTAPIFTKNINWDNDIDAETNGTWGGEIYTEKVESAYYYVNILNYADSWNDFKNKYKQIKIDFEGYVDYKQSSKSWL